MRKEGYELHREIQEARPTVGCRINGQAIIRFD